MKEFVRIIRYSWILKRYYISIALFVIAIALLNQVTPFIMKFIVDGLVDTVSDKDVPFSFFALLVGLNFLAGILVTFFSNVSGHWGDQLAVKLNSLLSERYFKHVLTLPIGYFDAERVGAITSKLERGIGAITDFMQAMTNNFSSFFLTALITLSIIAYYSWPAALFLAVLFPLYIWITTLSSRAWQRKQEKMNRLEDVARGRFVESVSQIRAVKSFVKEAFEFGFFARQREAIEKLTKTQSREWHNYDAWRRVSLNIIFLGIYGFIVYQTFLGKFTLGEMTLLLQLATQAQFPLFASSFIVDRIQKAAAGSRDFFEVLDIQPRVADSPRAAKLAIEGGRVVFDSVFFEYVKGIQVLDNVSFAIEPGQKLALVGESGEGKTTIANLLLRFYDPVSGAISIDGQDVAKATQGSLRENIAVVFQEPTLFSGTVQENISYGRKGAAFKEIVKASLAANAHTFISKLPKGYDTEIGERGVKLSQGQKQRIAIARAILKNAPILILDEATSSLDSKAEREVQKALEVLMEGRTTLIIAHRLSTIQNVDMIVTLQEGRVKEMGSPKKLSKSGGIYQELLKLQAMPLVARKSKLKKYEMT